MVILFAPTVMIDGRVYTPKGWEWVLAFAIRGCEWAIKEANTLEFRRKILQSLKEDKEKEKAEAHQEVENKYNQTLSYLDKLIHSIK